MTDLDRPYHGTPPTPTTRPTGAELAAMSETEFAAFIRDSGIGTNTVHDGGPWRGPSVEEWVAKIAAASTPKREYDEQGRFQPWIRREGAA